jgi:hypothetical protein
LGKAPRPGHRPGGGAAPPPPTETPAEAKRKDAIELRKQAKEVEERTVWLHILLIGLEGIRSLALWVFLMDGTMTASRLKRKALDQLALARVNVQIAEINQQIAALQSPTPVTVATLDSIAAPPVAVEPVAAIDLLPEPVPAPEPTPEPLTLIDPAPANQGPRKGGKNSSMKKAAAKAARNRVLILADRSNAQAMKVAAE